MYKLTGMNQVVQVMHLYKNKPTIPSGSQLVKVYTNQDYVASSSSTSNRGNFWSRFNCVYEGYSTYANRPFTHDTTLC